MAQLEIIEQPGGRVWVAESIDWTGQAPDGIRKIGISTGTVSAQSERGMRYMAGQMYGVLGAGMIHAQHVFRGLRRDMYVREDRHAASKKLAVTWAARHDAVLKGDRFNTELEYLDAPANRVFAVYVSLNESAEGFPDIFGWAEHWTWISRDPNLPGAPIDWTTRYDAKIWSRGQ